MASGLPGVTSQEIVMFENGEIGQVMTLKKDSIEILLLTKKSIRVGSKIVRTKEYMSLPMSPELLGKTLNSLGHLVSLGKAPGAFSAKKPEEVRRIIDTNLSGREDYNLQVFQLLNLELWMRTFID